MRIKVLIADPDPESARQMLAWIEEYRKNFQCVTASTGKAATDLLRQENIGILVTELIFSDLDGFGLLDFINTHSPEVPVIVVSSHGRPKTREILIRKGAQAFLEKPLEAKKFLQTFDLTARRIQEGGSLNGASLDTFAQMIEMEQKTCTLRVLHPPSQGYGLLFFKNGDIVHARMPGGLGGVDAAYEILAWQPVSLMIENQCRIQTEAIQADLQALLMEAMRLKDERSERRTEVPVAPRSTLPTKSEEDVHKPNSAPQDPVYAWLETIGAQSLGIESVYQDAAWRDLVTHAQIIGSVFDAGKLKACYLNAGHGSQSILLPDEQDTVLALLPGCKREQIVAVLAHHPPRFQW